MKRVVFICFIVFFVRCFSLENQLLKLTLDQAELIAIENSNQVNEVRELLKKAKEGRLESISKWLPRIDVYSAAFRASEEQFFSNAKSAFLSQLALTQSIFSSDVYYNIKISTLIEKQLELLLHAAIIDVLFQTRVAYYQVILDIENIHAAEEKVELLSFLSKKMEDRYAIGTSILYNVNQAKVAIANATTEYYETIKKKKIDLDILAKVLGYNPGEVQISFAKIEIPVQEIPELKDKLEKLEPLLNQNTMNLGKAIFKEDYPESEQRVMQKLYSRYEIKTYEEKALKYQPTLKVFENEVDIAKKEVSKQLGEYIPKVGFTFGVGGAPTSFIFIPSSKISNEVMQWGAGISLNWLVFDSLGRERRVRQARYQRNAKYFKYRKETQDTFANVRKSVFEIEESAANFLTASSNVKLAEQTIKLADDQLDVGYATIFDYQITVDGLIQAVNTKNKARYDLLKAYYSLIHATGEDLMNHYEVKGDKSKF